MTQIFHGTVVAIEELYKTKNYSFCLERLVTLQDERGIKEKFFLNDETKLPQGSYFELGDELEIQYDLELNYPYMGITRYLAHIAMILKSKANMNY